MMAGAGGAVMGGPSVPLDEGWALIMESGFKPLVATLDGAASGSQTSAETWINVHTTVYQMCIQKAPGPYSRELYERVGEALDKYLESVTLPALRELYAEFMLSELVRRWENHKNMVKWIQRIFKYLDRFYVRRLEIPNLETVGYTVFLTRVFGTVKSDVRSAVLDIVQRERDGALAAPVLWCQCAALCRLVGPPAWGPESSLYPAVCHRLSCPCACGCG